MLWCSNSIPTTSRYPCTCHQTATSFNPLLNNCFRAPPAPGSEEDKKATGKREIVLNKYAHMRPVTFDILPLNLIIWKTVLGEAFSGTQWTNDYIQPPSCHPHHQHQRLRSFLGLWFGMLWQLNENWFSILTKHTYPVGFNSIVDYFLFFLKYLLINVKNIHKIRKLLTFNQF